MSALPPAPAPQPGPQPGPRDAAGWEARYRAGDTPWDLGEAPAILRTELARLGPGAGRRALVPGAGHGHDALALARAGWQVTAVDIAPSPCARLRERAREEGLAVEVLEADLLHLPPALDGRFVLAWEQTCLCALDPAQRVAYVAALARVLAPGGLLLALLWNHGNPGGPPHDLPPGVVRPLYAPWFDEQAHVPVVPAPGASIARSTSRGGVFAIAADPSTALPQRVSCISAITASDHTAASVPSVPTAATVPPVSSLRRCRIALTRAGRAVPATTVRGGIVPRVAAVLPPLRHRQIRPDDQSSRPVPDQRRGRGPRRRDRAP